MDIKGGLSLSFGPSLSSGISTGEKALHLDGAVDDLAVQDGTSGGRGHQEGELLHDIKKEISFFFCLMPLARQG